MDKAKMTGNTKDKWDKLDIILKFVGGIITASAVALVGFLGTRFLAQRQEAETNARLYAELMSHRAEAENSLRKELLNSMMANFLNSASSKQLDKMVLNLDIMAYNFNDSIDLGPLFSVVYKNLSMSPSSEQNKNLINRVLKVSQEVINRQTSMLEGIGEKRDATIVFDEMKQRPEGVTVIDDWIEVRSGERPGDPKIKKHVKVDALDFVREARELQVRLTVMNPSHTFGVDTVFWVGPFDFSMRDSPRLPQGDRCAIVLRNFSEEAAEITLVYFTGTRTSIRDRLYSDQVIYDLLHARQLLDMNKPR
jgi:hypothetical protein